VVNNKSLVSIKGNLYSVPTKWVGQTVEARVDAQDVVIFKQGKNIAHHVRSYDQHKMIVELDHYLELLRYKPGALPGSLALKKAKETGQWPELYDDYWKALRDRFELHQANRIMVDFLWWARDFCLDDLTMIMRQALNSSSIELDAIKMLMRQYLYPQLDENKLDEHVLGHLKQYDRPRVGVSEYDYLLNTMGVVS
jgi:hypothetical protein